MGELDAYYHPYVGLHCETDRSKRSRRWQFVESISSHRHSEVTLTYYISQKAVKMGLERQHDLPSLHPAAFMMNPPPESWTKVVLLRSMSSSSTPVRLGSSQSSTLKSTYSSVSEIRFKLPGTVPKQVRAIADVSAEYCSKEPCSVAELGL